MNRLVEKSHVASYVDPITIDAGEQLNLTGRRDEWDGHVWLWAVAADGREGWIPDTLPEVKDGHRVASYTYSTAELTVYAGDVIDTLRETHGWVWGANDKSEQGWVPINVLAPR